MTEQQTFKGTVENATVQQLLILEVGEVRT